MLRFAVFALLVAVASANRYSQILGVVEGVVPCGSKGEVLQVRVTDCTSVPCTIIKGQTYQIEVDFKPSAAHTELDVLVSVITEGKETRVVDETLPAVVSPGNAYTLAYPWTVRGDFNGLVALHIQLQGNGIIELCGLATAIVRESITIIR
ncbi:unnamed protein product [Allacma fusca]|uniref:MD-2-related lipid-recognition domain-containing protein n=1 Tax=Allacma fusca TaxID=39272 RepID=A0A8J2JQT3_9HEXA|nr:unnamed protein product [Allacma fusca]